MRIWKNLSAGLKSLFYQDEAEQELDDELRDYLEQAVAEKMRQGMARGQALRAARVEMGGAEVVKEKVRAASWETRIENLWNDLRFGMRLLRFNPVFAAAAILSLALGIGANAAIFQLLDAVQMRTLPVKGSCCVLNHTAEIGTRVRVPAPRATDCISRASPRVPSSHRGAVRRGAENAASRDR